MAVWAGRIRAGVGGGGGEERPRFYFPFDAALLIPDNNKDDLVIYMYR